MKKYISIILTFAIVISGLYTNTVAFQDVSADSVYSGSYGSQLGRGEDDLSGYFYDEMVKAYIYQEGDDGNTDGRYTGLAKPLGNNKAIVLEPEELVFEKTVASQSDFEAEFQTWFQAKSTMISSSLRDAFDAFVKDYPEVYWMKSISIEENATVQIASTDSGINGTAKVKLTLQPEEYSDGMTEYIVDFNEAVLSVKDTMVSEYGITQDTETENIAKYIQDYIAGKVDYNYEAVDKYDDINYGYAYTPLPVFLDSETWDNLVVCEGYSKAFKILCRQFGIESVLLIGQSVNPQGQFESHMWNAVKIADKWYAVDVAWDDQADQIYDNYFLAGNDSQGFFATYKEDHIAENKFSSYDTSKEFIIPQIADKGFRQQNDEESGEITTDTKDDDTETTTKDSSSDDTGTTTKDSSSDDTGTTTKDGSSDDTGTTTKDGSSNNAETTTKDVNSNNTQITTSKTDEDSVVAYTLHWQVTGYKKKMTYTGKAVTQVLKVTMNGTSMKEGTDYVISYKNNVKPGTATVTITPAGRYRGSALAFDFNFTITKASIKKAVSSKVKAQKYKKGKAIKPAVKLKFNGKKLKKGRDYTVTYKKNKKKGTAKIIIKGKGSFKGKKTIKFKIK